MTHKKYKFTRRIIDKNGVSRRYHFKPSNWKIRKEQYEKTGKGFKKIEQPIGGGGEGKDRIYRSSIVYNYDVMKGEDGKEKTPTGNRAELRVIFWSEVPATDDQLKYLNISIRNLNAKLLYTYIGASKNETMKLTIGEEINEKVSLTEMKPEDKMFYCIKYLRIESTNPKRTYILDNTKTKDKAREIGLNILDNGFIMNPTKSSNPKYNQHAPRRLTPLTPKKENPDNLISDEQRRRIRGY